MIIDALLSVAKALSGRGEHMSVCLFTDTCGVGLSGLCSEVQPGVRAVSLGSVQATAAGSCGCFIDVHVSPMMVYTYDFSSRMVHECHGGGYAPSVCYSRV